MAVARKFQFVPFGERAPDGALCCDGLVDGETLHLSHWMHNRTPAQWKADTSVEIALRYAEASGPGDLVVNNHFDTDGVLAVWCLLEPEIALAHRDLVIGAAEAGDFDEWPANERGLQLDRAVHAIASRTGGDASAYEMVLPKLAAVVSDLDGHASLWRDEWAALERASKVARDGGITVEKIGSIAVFVHREGLSEMPGPVLSRDAPAGCTRWLLAFDRGRGQWEYRYERVRWAWADTVVRPAVPAPSRNALVAPLGPGWAVKGDFGMTGLLRTVHPVARTPVDVATALSAAELAAAGRA